MILFALTNVITGVIAFLLGFFALLKNKKDPINLHWFLTSLAITVWSLAFVGVILSKDYHNADIWQYVLDAASIWIPIFFFLFSFSLSGKTWNKKILYFVSFLLGFIITTFTFTHYFRSGLSPILSFNYWVNPGPLYYVSPAIYASFVLAACILLVSSLRKARGFKKLQLKYVLIAAIVGFGGGATNFLPQLIHFYPIGNYFVIVYTFLITYSIAKHRLMDIRMVVARSLAYTLLIAIVGFFYSATAIWTDRVLFPVENETLTVQRLLVRIAVTLVVLFTFLPLKNWITKKTDKIFYKRSYDPDEVLDNLSHTMSSSIVLIELLYKVLNILTEDMKVSRGFFVIMKDGKTIDTTQGVGYKKSPNINVKEIETLCQDGISIYDELDENSKKKSILRRHDASIAIPLKSTNKMSGVLFLGEKSSGDMYSPQDLKIFEILGPEVTVAIENAKSYEEIQQFNAVLRSEIQKATHDLELANRNLRELDKAKDEFITMASHQLRTPLTAIKGYLSMLLEGDAGEIKVGQYEFIQEAYYGATRMVSLINDLLNVSRMETGRFFLEVSEFDVTRTTEEEIKQLDKAVKDKGLKLVFKKPSKHLTLCADEMKVRQVIMNFIDNAIYYTLNGKITVKLYTERENICFEVADNGIGVPAEQQKHLFTKFYRAENARSTRPDGTGLGLFMAKKVIEEHHGEIIFHSVEGKGSTFGFKLPKAAKAVQKNSAGFDRNIPSTTPIDKVKEKVTEKMKSEDQSSNKEKVVTAR